MKHFDGSFVNGKKPRDKFSLTLYLSVKINLSNLYIFQSHIFFMTVVLIWFPNIRISISWDQTKQVYPFETVPMMYCGFLGNYCFLSKYGLSTHRHQRCPKGMEDMAGQISSLSKMLYRAAFNSIKKMKTLISSLPVILKRYNSQISKTDCCYPGFCYLHP